METPADTRMMTREVECYLSNRLGGKFLMPRVRTQTVESDHGYANARVRSKLCSNGHLLNVGRNLSARSFAYCGLGEVT
jgi:hypothetical protein